jgi:hypothetical protein
MAEPLTWSVLEALETQLGVISIANGYHTDIGTLILRHTVQRPDSRRPSIAIGAPAGDLDLTGESGANGAQISPRARRMALVLEAAVDVNDAEEAEHIGHLMLEDFERADAIRTGLAPTQFRKIKFTRWAILDRPDGLKSVVLQIEGTAEYLRPQ